MTSGIFQIKFTGHSDDIIYIEGGPDADEYYHNGKKKTFLVAGTDGSLKVHCYYDGFYHFAIGLVDEDVPLPEWGIYYFTEGYSAALRLTVPKGTRVHELKDK